MLIGKGFGQSSRNNFIHLFTRPRTLKVQVCVRAAWTLALRKAGNLCDPEARHD